MNDNKKTKTKTTKAIIAATTILAVVASAAIILGTQMSQYALAQTNGSTAGSASNPVMVDPSQREERIGRMKAGHTHTQIFALRKEILHGRTLRCR